MQASMMTLIHCLVACALPGNANNDQGVEKATPPRIRFSTFAEEYARENFSGLLKDGDVDKLFSDFSAIAHAHAFMRDPTTKKQYQHVIVDTFEIHLRGNLFDAMFANFLLNVTPPEILLEAIVPELGPKGKLTGILDHEAIDLRRYLERQSPQGHAGNPDFRHYAQYLSNQKDLRSSEPLVAYMFRRAPSQALYAMMYVEYWIPYPPPRLSGNPDVNKVIRPLFLAEHLISDVIWHKEHRFDVDPERIKKAKDVLTDLSTHENWWVRLYAAEIMLAQADLRVQDAINRIKNDKHELVKKVSIDYEQGNK